jgi:ribonucleoside-diphosphate reductase alpha chain
MFIQNISQEVWGGEAGKYRLRDSEGQPIDLTPEDTCLRVAKGLASLEPKPEEWEVEFSRILLEGKFAGGGRIMANVGAGDLKRDASPINCTVLRQIPDSMDGIMQTAKESAMTLRTGAGVGYDFSPIRPSGAYVFGAGAETSGVISFMKIFDATCSTVMSGGGRRGAQMGCLDIQHPEIENFITCKREDGVLRYFNLSVLITDAFMTAVRDDAMWKLWFWERCEKCDIEEIGADEVAVMKAGDIPFRYPEYDYFSYAADHTEVLSGNCEVGTIFKKRVFKVLRAVELFDKIMTSTYNFAEPGFILIDRVNRDNILWFCEVIRATNPCVPSDTWVHTEEGPKQVSDLIGQECTLMVNGKPYQSEGFFKTGYKSVLNLETKEGFKLRLTPNHKVMVVSSNNGDKIISNWKEAGEIEIGDKVILHDHSDSAYWLGTDKMNGVYSVDQGYLMGLLVGDGTLKKDSAILSVWSSDNENGYESIMSRVNMSIRHLKKRADFKGWHKIAGRNEYRLKLSGIRDLAHEFGMSNQNKFITPKMEKASHAFSAGFLRGLFDADGSVQGDQSKGVSVRLAQSNLETLEAVQRMLLRFGIVSKIYKFRRESGESLLPNGKGGKKLYKTKAQHELVISKSNLKTFERLIGFADDTKHSKLVNLLSDYKRELNKESYAVTISSISDGGICDVYDVQVPGINAFDANGIYVHNCGEQPLPANASCLLASMILAPYVMNKFADDSFFDWEAFEVDIAVATRMMDNVVEINNLPLPEMREQILQKRRHGLGFTGLGTVFNMLGMSYGDDASQAFADKIAYTIAKVSLFMNMELAQEKGHAPIFDTIVSRQNAIDSGYMKRLLSTFDDDLRHGLEQEILEHGLRFSHATSIAPTGTMSLTWGNNCSNGVEPSFTDEYARNFRQHGKKTKVQEIVRSLEYHLWIEMYGDRELPSHWRVSNDLSVEDHINIQAKIQKWVDSAVSKTANVPTDYPFEDFKKIYMMGWEKGLKGITTFRYNPEAFSGVLVRKEDLENTKYVFILADNEEITVSGSDTIEYDGELHNAANLFDALKEGMYGDM